MCSSTYDNFCLHCIFLFGFFKVFNDYFFSPDRYYLFPLYFHRGLNNPLEVCDGKIRFLILMSSYLLLFPESQHHQEACCQRPWKAVCHCGVSQLSVPEGPRVHSVILNSLWESTQKSWPPSLHFFSNFHLSGE